jgi:hypothetical protein
VPLLLACGINGSAPGDYNITFSVTNSAGRRAVVKRQLKVKAVCPEGEQLCDDQVRRDTAMLPVCVSLALQLVQLLWDQHRLKASWRLIDSWG